MMGGDNKQITFLKSKAKKRSGDVQTRMGVTLMGATVDDDAPITFRNFKFNGPIISEKSAPAEKDTDVESRTGRHMQLLLAGFARQTRSSSVLASLHEVHDVLVAFIDDEHVLVA